MKILAFDTSTKFLSIACLEDNIVKGIFHKDAGIRHSELLICTAGKMMKKIGWDIKEIELISVGLGPGSFTGLRVAIATVKALALALPCKITGVVTMDAIVLNAPKQRTCIAPFLDARKEKVYTCIYKKESGNIERITDYLLVSVDDFLSGLNEKIFFFGDAVEKYKEKLKSCSNAEYSENIDWYPRADEIGRIGYKKFLAGETKPPQDIEPLYLHAKECDIEVRNWKLEAGS